MSAAPNYGLDWFEGAISRPDLVLLDFAAAVRPQEYPVSNTCLQALPCNSQLDLPVNAGPNQI